MKTICPHCKQEYPEVPDEYSGMTLQCSVCQKEFVCEKAKFCSECGQCNEAKALKCSQCGNSFPEDVDWTTAWKKIAVFSGRAGQKEYGLFVGQLILLLFVGDLILLLFVLGIPSLISHRSGLQIVVWFMVILSSLSSLVSIPLCIRRLHDIGVSGWWSLIVMPLNASNYFIPLLLIPSQAGANKWGLNPVGVSSCDFNNSKNRLFRIISPFSFCLVWLILFFIKLFFG